MEIRPTEEFDWTIEELGRNSGKTLEVTISVYYHEGEERTWDYPGSPAYFELVDVRVKTWDNDTDVDIAPGSWQEALDRIAYEYVEGNLDEILDMQFS